MKHVMKTVSEDPATWVIECPDCERKLLLDRTDMTKVVLDYGDKDAIHRWSSTAHVSVSAELT